MAELVLPLEARTYAHVEQQEPQNSNQTEMKALAGAKPFVFNGQHYEVWKSAVESWWALNNIVDHTKRALSIRMFISLSIGSIFANGIKFTLDTFWVDEANVFHEPETIYLSPNRDHHALDRLGSLKMIGHAFRSLYAKWHACCAKAKVDCDAPDMMLKFLKNLNNEATRGGLMS